MQLYVFDLMGTYAFALSGALLGLKKDMDVYGALVLAFAAAAGGGTVRDVLLNLQPFILRDPNYIYAIIAAVATVFFFKNYVERVYKPLIVADAVGLGIFTIIGAKVGISAGISGYAVVIISVLTGTGGGMLRDIIANEVPIVLTKEIYASACFLGGVIFLFLHNQGVSEGVNAVTAAGAVIFIRLFTLKKNYHLPRRFR